MMDLHSLLLWYSENGRHHLPWRTDPTWYRVWVSEIMLQQTQVATVIDYFHRFLAAFPDVETLANADESDVLRHWEGLGYYRRARQLYAAAKVMVEKFSGQFPEKYSDVLALPGIGKYTAGAILSFACQQRYPILEANTQRLHARLLGLNQPVSDAMSQKRLWQNATDWVCQEQEKPGVINTALMDLGSMVCVPKNPRCDACPLVRDCEAYRRGWVEKIPVVTEKTRYENRHDAAMVVKKGDQICLLRYVSGQRWAGLWDFPRTEIPDGADTESTLRAFLKKNVGLNVRVGKPLKSLRHGVTKYRIRLDCFSGTALSPASLRKQTPQGGEIRWVPLAQLHQYPLSSTGRKIAEMLSHDT
ncbi:MAG: A/G-specific adenine glycosylase [Planctomycetia bacterium]|nr:A/G-specific adenine glycosylase [Planctomycetia bacterium]